MLQMYVKTKYVATYKMLKLVQNLYLLIIFCFSIEVKVLQTNIKIVNLLLF